MPPRSKGYSTDELEKLKAAVADKVPFDKLEAEFPGRTAYGLKRKAQALGLLRRPVSSEQSVRQMLKEANSPVRAQVSPDQRFQNAMHNAIEAGRESAVFGTIKTACTIAPRPLRGDPLIYIRSSAGLAADMGETEQPGGHFAHSAL